MACKCLPLRRIAHADLCFVLEAGCGHHGVVSMMATLKTSLHVLFEGDTLISPSVTGVVLQDVRAKLPGPAHSLYYKDLIGNISSSNTVHTPKQVRAQVGTVYTQAAADTARHQQQQSQW